MDARLPAQSPVAPRDGHLPLGGLRVVELVTFVAGPLAGLTLAQLGADVIRVDPIGGAPDHRRWPLAADGRSLYWTELNRGKRSVCVDLHRPEGRELVLALATAAGPGSGAFVTNAVGRAWLSDAELRARRADMLHVQLQGHADGGAAVDYTVNAATGFPLATGPRGVGEPVNHVLPAWDVAAGMATAVALLGAEQRRRETGQGAFVRIALADVALAVAGYLGLLAEAELNGVDRPRDGNHIYGSFGADFVTADGQRVMVAAITPRQWRGLCEVTSTVEAMEHLGAAFGVDLRDEGGRYAARDAIRARLSGWFGAQTADGAVAALREAGVLCDRYRTFRQALSDAVDRDDSVLRAVDDAGLGAYHAPASPLRFADVASEPGPPPRLGRETEAVLAEVLGLSATEIGALRDDGVVGDQARG